MTITDILKKAKTEREKAFNQVMELDTQTAALKAKRAEILINNDMDGNTPELMKVNEKLHNLRRCRSVVNGQREKLDFMIQYLETEGNTGSF